MSFADPSSKTGSSRDRLSSPEGGRGPGHPGVLRRRRPVPDDAPASTIDRPRGSPYRNVVDWQHVGLVGVGLLVGALVGAGAALLLAPQSGVETRSAIGRRARHVRRRASDVWADLADDLEAATRQGRRRARRVLRRARWRASDTLG